ncbi:MAG: ATP phosphoribosyltransferase regulatory subunit [Burkholderiales bacterium]
MKHNWLLPEYIEDVLPPLSWRLESVRRAILDLFWRHGYELVQPPLLEYLESLLTGTGHDLDLKTFKLVDQLSGRHMGLRADITPQAARIDAHLMNNQGVNRLCYSGSVLQTRPDSMLGTREPLQIGAELFGHAGLESDFEIQTLMVNALALAGAGNVFIDLGHVAIFRALVSQTAQSSSREMDLFQALQSKDTRLLAELTSDLEPALAKALCALPELNGGPAVLDHATSRLPAGLEIANALNDLKRLGKMLNQRGIRVSYDLAELRGYSYHSGIVFAAYAEGYRDAVAKGGRYDQVGKAFGRARSATGFSIDLREVLSTGDVPGRVGILAPYRADDAILAERVAALRNAGERVVVELPGSVSDAAELGLDRRLVFEAGAWHVKPFLLI